jgi:hypothetical protein
MNDWLELLTVRQAALAAAMVLGILSMVVAFGTPAGKDALARAGLRVFAALIARLVDWIADYAQRTQTQRAVLALRRAVCLGEVK